MKEYELTPLEREVFGEMARRNGTDTEMICKTCIHNDRMYRFHYFADRSRPPLTDISSLVRLEGLMRVEIYQCDIRDLSPLSEIPTLESITVSGGSELLPCDFTPLKKLGNLSLHYDCCNVPKLTGLPLKTVSLSRIESLEGLAGLGVTPGPVLERDAINVFQETNGVKLPGEYVASLTQVGDGFEIQLQSFVYRFPPLSKVKFDPECVGKRFSHREAWLGGR